MSEGKDSQYDRWIKLVSPDGQPVSVHILANGDGIAFDVWTSTDDDAPADSTWIPWGDVQREPT